MTGFERADGKCPHQFSCRYQWQVEHDLKSLSGKCGDERVFFSVTDDGVTVEQDFLMFAQGASQQAPVNAPLTCPKKADGASSLESEPQSSPKKACRRLAVSSAR